MLGSDCRVWQDGVLSEDELLEVEHDLQDMMAMVEDEKELKTLNPKVRNITYDIADLYAYLDQLQDLSCLVFNQQMNAYLPRGKDWIKQQVFHHLRRQAQGA